MGGSVHLERSFAWFLLLDEVKSVDIWKPVKFLPKEQQPNKNTKLKLFWQLVESLREGII